MGSRGADCTSDHNDASPVDKGSGTLLLVPDNDTSVMDKWVMTLLVPDSDTSQKDRSLLPDPYISKSLESEVDKPPVSLLLSCGLNILASAVESLVSSKNLIKMALQLTVYSMQKVSKGLHDTSVKLRVRCAEVVA